MKGVIFLGILAIACAVAAYYTPFYRLQLRRERKRLAREEAAAERQALKAEEEAWEERLRKNREEGTP